VDVPQGMGTGRGVVPPPPTLLPGLGWGARPQQPCFVSSQIQVIKIETEDNRETRSAKDALLLWCQMKTAG